VFVRKATIFKRTLCENQDGVVLLFTLLTVLAISLMATAMLNTDLMNSRINNYDIQAEQAQMACDAGVDWLMELIFAELNQDTNLNAVELPALLECSDQNLSLWVENGWCNAGVGSITRQVSSRTNACDYDFTITATFARASKKVQVQVTYDFEGGYFQMDDGGNSVFLPRQYTNRGHVSRYKPLF